MRSSKIELQTIANRLKPLSTGARRGRFIVPLGWCWGNPGRDKLAPTRNKEKLPQDVESQDIGSLDEMKDVLSQPGAQAEALVDDQLLQHILVYCHALYAQLETAADLSNSWRQAHTFLPVHIRFPHPAPSRLRLHNPLANLRSNLTPRSTAFRHAIRLGVALSIAAALYEFIPLPIMQRGYWIPLTAALVLRSDFATTFTRGIARLIGTLLGAVLTTLLIVLLAPSHDALIIILAVAAYVSYSILFANYAVFSIVITVEVVILLSFVYPQTLPLVEFRAINTAIGGVLALLIFLIWPTWEQPQIAGNLAQRLESLHRYLHAVIQAYIDPKSYNAGSVDKLRNASRLARSNANGSVQRALQEPITPVRDSNRIKPQTAQGLLDAADNIARNTLALEAYIQDASSHQIHALPSLTPFLHDLDHSLDTLAAAIRENSPASSLPDLQQALPPLRSSITDSRAQDKPEVEEQFIAGEVGEIIPNILVMQQLLSKGNKI
jgi:uncharacterized membrane protein YccC